MNIKTPTCLTLHYVILVFWLILMQNRASFRQSRSYDTYTYCKILLHSGRKFLSQRFMTVARDRFPQKLMGVDNAGARVAGSSRPG